MAIFFKDKRGDILTGVITFPIIAFIVIFGFLYIHAEQVRAGVSMASREAAREYGIQLGQANNDPSLIATAQFRAREKARDVLHTEGLFDQNQDFNNGQPDGSQRDATISFTNNGVWTTCTITYYLPNLFSGSERLISHNTWMSKFFKIQVTSASKYEETEK
ncbi:hypothetical protein ACETAC_01405 [Aceticella autotrophica]|uniref:Uncharacterized protein n=1 Tax=Aceticella autotrophica TaxID=2755338 RepID=A0A975AW78_9THEO|nr:hypothetical protein [Aceticella autotrophica]QSZ27600.1 hypothetical protein ACETAC_01405 [Aceticella autotrophica]